MMADTMETLEIEVKHKASGATNEIDKLTDSLLRLNRILAGTTIPKLENLAKALSHVTKAEAKMTAATSGKSTANKVKEKTFDPLSEGQKEAIRNFQKYEVAWLKLADKKDKMEAALSKGDAVSAVYGREKVLKAQEEYNKEYWKVFGANDDEEEKVSVWDRIKTAIKGATVEIQKLAQSSDKATKHTNKLVSSFGRIMFYRAIRKVISEISKAFSEGLQNAYAYSSMIGSSISQTMDSFASLGMLMKNQLGSAFGELLTTLRPIIEFIINLITKAADALSQFFAVLGGRSVYHKATTATTKWAEETEKGAEAAKEWKNQLMGFDEINRLEAPMDTGSGSGGMGNNIGGWELSPVTMDFSWLEKIKAFFASLNLEPLMESLGRLKDVALDLFETIKKWVAYIWENILAPFIRWFVEELAPVVIDVIASILEVINALMEVICPVLMEIWENVLAPLFEWIGEFVIAVLTDLTNFLHDLAQLISGEITWDEFISGLSDTEILVGSLALAFGVVFIAVGLFNGIIGVATTVVSIFGGVLTFLAANPIALAIIAIAAIIAVVLLAIKHWDEWKQKLEEWAESFSEHVGNGKLEWEDFAWVFVQGAQRLMMAIENIIDTVRRLIGWIKDAISWFQQLFEVQGGTTIEASGFSYGGGGQFASGGFPSEGELFLAREAGPEMVGTIGGRTAVANNADIVAAIEGGVYNAMASALSVAGGNRSGGGVVLNINGREFMRAIWDDRNAVIAEHGVSLVTYG